MKKMSIDESLAFTALLALDPGYRNLSPQRAAVRRDALLTAWYAQEELPSLWTFTERWLSGAITQETQPEPAAVASPERYFADEMNGFFADPEGFHDPEKAAAHAIIVQGGFSTPLREAARMIKDGGVHEQRARAWMRAKGHTDADLEKS